MESFTDNGLGHFDICGPDTTQLQSFYQGVFKWAIHPKGPGYALVQTPAGSANAALIESEKASITIGITVSHLEETINRTISGGGQIVMPITDNGWVKKAIISDPAGNQLTIIQA
jgi:predicted enzyme related to lactoylglutathione lyase